MLSSPIHWGGLVDNYSFNSNQDQQEAIKQTDGPILLGPYAVRISLWCNKTLYGCCKSQFGMAWLTSQALSNLDHVPIDGRCPLVPGSQCRGWEGGGEGPNETERSRNRVAIGVGRKADLGWERGGIIGNCSYHYPTPFSALTQVHMDLHQSQLV